MAPNSNFYIFIILLENQKVFHSFASRAQPSSDKLTGDVTGVVRLAGRLLSMDAQTGGDLYFPTRRAC